MAVSLLDGVSQLAPFSCKSDSNIGARWRRWKRSFDYFVLAKNVTDLAQQKALLLQTASIDVQDIYHTLTEQPSEDDVYYEGGPCSGQLFSSADEHSIPTAHLPTLQQRDDESLDQYVISCQKCLKLLF